MLKSMMKSSIIKKTFIYFIGNLSSKILIALLIPIYAFFVSPSDLGNYDYIVAIMSILVPLSFFSMWDCILKYTLSEENEEEIAKIISTIFIFVSVFSTIFMMIYFVLFILNVINYPYFILSIVMMCSNGLVTLLQYSCRAFNKNRLYAMSGVISSFVNIALVLILVAWLKLGLLGLIISYTFSMLISAFLMEYKIKIRRYVKLNRFDIVLLKKMLLFSAPIVLNTVSLWGMNGISKIICVYYLDISANGLFSFANKFGSIIIIVGSIIGAVIMEEAYLEKDIGSYRRRFSKIINLLFSLYLTSAIFIIPILYCVYDLFFMNIEYYESKVLLFSVMLGAIFASISTNFGSAFQVTEKTNYVFVTSLIGASTSILLSLLFIDSYGIMAIAIGQMIGNFTLMISRACFAYRLTGLNVNWKKNILLVFIFFAVALVFMKMQFEIVLSLELVIILVIAILFRKNIKAIYSKLF